MLMRDPLPIGLNDKLEASDLGRCRHCRCWLYYQRVERPKYLKHFFFCGAGGPGLPRRASGSGVWFEVAQA